MRFTTSGQSSSSKRSWSNNVLSESLLLEPPGEPKSPFSRHSRVKHVVVSHTERTAGPKLRYVRCDCERARRLQAGGVSVRPAQPWLELLAERSTETADECERRLRMLASPPVRFSHIAHICCTLETAELFSLSSQACKSEASPWSPEAEAAARKLDVVLCNVSGLSECALGGAAVVVRFMGDMPNPCSVSSEQLLTCRLALPS
mmetsp:Transcript_19803/g.68795  ORF Transcript_19803/g.68795 Transcript_19803/m.68795 type:complete len:204 (+) Transcript_19803:1671-2282(+)